MNVRSMSNGISRWLGVAYICVALLIVTLTVMIAVRSITMNNVVQHSHEVIPGIAADDFTNRLPKLPLPIIGG